LGRGECPLARPRPRAAGQPLCWHAAPVLLTPERFLRDIPVATSEGLCTYAWRNNADDLRTDFNWDLAQNVGRQVRAKMARQNPTIVKNYLVALETEEHPSYDVTGDPQWIVHRRERNAVLATLPPLSHKPAEPAELDTFVREVIDDFRYSLEDSNGWRLFHYKDSWRTRSASRCSSSTSRAGTPTSLTW
jgi:hypothetical protein